MSYMPIPQADDGRFDDAFGRYWLTVFRFALAWTNDWSDAEDLAQEAFVRLWTRRKSVDWSTSMLPWLLTTTRRLATDRFRRVRRATRITSRSQTPALDSDARLTWLDVQSSLGLLSPMERASLVLTTVAGIQTDTVAGLLDSTPGAVRAAVSRGRSKLSER